MLFQQIMQAGTAVIWQFGGLTDSDKAGFSGKLKI